ncbi:hypothetical protein M422DRAFT_43178 [Sphaerobolus stellatus SS14]|nr:hypothetical protein M422DRAFT_43178 [Sphaerobolus stellatus SS14]
MENDLESFQTLVHDIGPPKSDGGRSFQYEPTVEVSVQHEILVWAIQSTTDPDVIALAAEMIPFAFWPPAVNIEIVIRQLQYTCHGSFDARGNILPGSEELARACFIAVLYLHCSRSGHHAGFINSPVDSEYVTSRTKNWLTERFNAVNFQDKTIYLIENEIFNWVPERVRVGKRLVEPILLPPDEIHMVWCFRIVYHYLAYINHLKCTSDEVYDISGVILIIDYYSSAAFKSNGMSQLLLCCAMVLGFQPEFNFLKLLDKSGFEDELLDEVLTRRLASFTNCTPDFDLVWSKIILQLFSHILRHIPSEFSIHKDQIPVSTWISILLGNKFEVAWLCDHLRILHSMICLENSDEHFDERRIFKFYEVFDSHVQLTLRQANLLFKALEHPLWNWSMKDDNSPLLLALGIIFVQMLISSPSVTSVGMREVTLQAAWCYRIQLENISDQSLKTRLIFALFTGATPLWKIPDYLENNSHAMLLPRLPRFTRCSTLIRSLLYQIPRCQYTNIKESPEMDTFSNTIGNLMSYYWHRYNDYPEGTDCLVSILAMMQELTEMSLRSYSVDFSERRDKPTIISVWRYLSLPRQLAFCAEFDHSHSVDINNPWYFSEPKWWALWRTVCNWSRDEYVNMDPAWLRKLYCNVQYVYDLVEPGLDLFKTDPWRKWEVKPIQQLKDFARILQEDIQRSNIDADEILAFSGLGSGHER